MIAVTIASGNKCARTFFSDLNYITPRRHPFQ